MCEKSSDRPLSPEPFRWRTDDTFVSRYLFRLLITSCLCFLSLNPILAQFNTELFQEARKKFDEGRLAEALAAFEAIHDDLKENGKEETDDFYYASTLILRTRTDLGQLALVKSVISKLEAGVQARASDHVKMEFEFMYGLFLGRVGEDLDEQLAHYKKANDLSIKNEDFIKGIAIKVAMIDALSRFGRYEQATPHINALIDLSIETYGPAHFRVATAYSRMALNLQGQRKIEECLKYWKEAVRVTIQEIDSTYLSSTVYGDDDIPRFFKDVNLLVKEHAVLDKVHPADLFFFQSTAYALLETGHLELAETLYRKTEALFMAYKEPRPAANSMVGLAIIYQKKFQLNYALARYKDALGYYKQLHTEENDAEAWVYHNMAIIFGDLGDYKEQLRYNKKALQIRKRMYSGKHPELAASYVGLGSSKVNVKDWQGALDAFDQGMDAGYNDPGYIEFRKGFVYYYQGLADTALPYFLKAIKLSNPDDPYYSRFCNAAGMVKLEKNQPDSALYYFEEGIKRKMPEGLDVDTDNFDIAIEKVENSYELLKSVSNIASAYLWKYQSGSEMVDLVKAQRVYTLCSRLKAEVRTEFIVEADQLKFYRLSREIAEDAINTNLRLFDLTGDDTYAYEAFFIADADKSQILLNSTDLEQGISSSFKDLLIRYSMLKSNIRKEKSRVSQKYLPASVSSDSLKSGKLLLTLQDDLSILLDGIKKSQPRLFDYLTQSRKMSSGAELKQLSNETDRTILAYFVGNDSLYVFKSDKWEITVETRACSGLREHVNRFRNYITSPENVSEESFRHFIEDGKFLYQTLIPAGLVKKNGINKVLIIPDDFLVSVPFETLITADYPADQISFGNLEYLIKRLDISYASSASLLKSNSRTEKNRGDVRFVAWAPFSRAPGTGALHRSESLAHLPLPGGTSELASLESLFEGSALYEGDANESSFKKRATGKSILHIATHGVLDNNNPDLSHLVFGETADSDSINDNLLYVFEVYGLSLNTDLVVLTACHSGAGEVNSGEGAMSLARAFKYAGVKSVVMSLWLANDASTSFITHEFYKNLSNKKSKAASLREAKLTYLAQADRATAHPFYWSHLTMSGVGSPLFTVGNKNMMLWVFCGLCILSSLSFVFFRQNKSQNKPFN